MNWSIVSLAKAGPPHRMEAAEILVAEFREHWPDAWPTLESAQAEVAEAFEDGRLAFAAVEEGGSVLGWIGARPSYGGTVWELHPLAVRGHAQGKGIGRSLVEHLEVEIRRRGALTLWLGTDDEAGLTSLGGIELYPDVLGKLADIEARRAHPLGFYRRLGFEVTGVVPDANGFGCPDILMAKRVSPPSAVGQRPSSEP